MSKRKAETRTRIAQMAAIAGHTVERNPDLPEEVKAVLKTMRDLPKMLARLEGADGSNDN